MELIITDRAERDLDLRAAFWEENSSGLGMEYLIHLSEQLQILSEISEAATFSNSGHPFHRFLTVKFSTQVFYEVKESQVIIHAVFDCREDPSKIREEISRRR